jgi:hypothetical protein
MAERLDGTYGGLGYVGRPEVEAADAQLGEWVVAE